MFRRKASVIEKANSISELFELNLNGVKQWIYIRGEDKTKPGPIHLREKTVIYLLLDQGRDYCFFGNALNITVKLVTLKHWSNM